MFFWYNRSMWEIFIDKLPLIIIVVAVFLVLFFFFPLVFFLCVALPFLILKTGYHAFVKHMHEHSLWWDIPLILAIILSIVFVILFLNGYR